MKIRNLSLLLFIYSIYMTAYIFIKGYPNNFISILTGFICFALALYMIGVAYGKTRNS